ncbi:metal ABC transporter ATP-binding protein [Clostridium estertheticum]|uniref:metal ABC transporter ATP-binding protein n=1 Tax=Clostridium estertheticum TaxID=238834 RepID=UPI00124C15CE|nr:metal ABC transporter ATP-binding protein [Clostridium estertheticum]MBU3076124.1 metal ABC transporter ATP-binding protein [Clostridium estertheticum]MBU3165923.1 metal ABC transporter ATP-binding protein [Clostridium estertheticum]MBZ9616025.1 metal ABC transporter ATP-binding protein [Clostridium estertheticum subsp. laramiense]WAG75888.1 metal ABC transporter ATP-binding protein [Clostridium estertheticum]
MIQINNLFFSYTSGAPYILNDISLTINNGEYLSILGDNGSGKSTLVKLILNFLSPTKGSIVNSDKNIGYVPQKSDFLNSQFPITVYEMLNCYRKVLKIKDKTLVTRRLEAINMLDFKDSLIGTLSGGQCQKIFIVRALLGNPDLLILDEPSTGIDVTSQKEIYSLIRDLNKNNKITVIAIEHNLNAAMSNSSLIYHLSKGKGHLCTPDIYIKEYLKANKEEEFNVSV